MQEHWGNEEYTFTVIVPRGVAPNIALSMGQIELLDM